MIIRSFAMSGDCRTCETGTGARISFSTDRAGNQFQNRRTIAGERCIPAPAVTTGFEHSFPLTAWVAPGTMPAMSAARLDDPTPYVTNDWSEGLIAQ